MDGLDGLFGTVNSLGGAAFQWMTAADQAAYRAREAEVWASAYAAAAPSVATANAAGAVAVSAGRDKLFLAGFAILAVVVLFRIRPTANS